MSLVEPPEHCETTDYKWPKCPDCSCLIVHKNGGWWECPTCGWKEGEE